MEGVLWIVWSMAGLAILGDAVWVGVRRLRQNPEALLKQSVQAEKQGTSLGPSSS